MICMMANGIRMATFTFYHQAKSSQERSQLAATVTLFVLTLLVGVGVLVIPFTGPLARWLEMEGESSLLVFAILTVMADLRVIHLRTMHALRDVATKWDDLWERSEVTTPNAWQIGYARIQTIEAPSHESRAATRNAFPRC
jgi:hypothetical protein